MVIPKGGIYATKVYINGKTYYGATNIGYNPTVNGDTLSQPLHTPSTYVCPVIGITSTSFFKSVTSALISPTLTKSLSSPIVGLLVMEQ